MGSVKYSKIKTSNGPIGFTRENNMVELYFNNYKYLKVYNISLFPGGNFSYFKIYINNSDDYIILTNDSCFVIEDFAINNVKIEYIFDDDKYDDLNWSAQLQYYLCK